MNQGLYICIPEKISTADIDAIIKDIWLETVIFMSKPAIRLRQVWLMCMMYDTYSFIQFQINLCFYFCM